MPRCRVTEYYLNGWKPSQKAADNRMVLSIDLGKEHAAEGKSKCKDKGMFE